MAWRFQASKFKNTTPHIPKKEDTIFDVPVGNLSCTNNGIQASASYLAFHVEGEGGKLGVLPVEAKGRRTRKDMSIVCAHGEQVDDFCFMTFNDDLLVTCSRDDAVKVWRLSGEEAAPALEHEVFVGSGQVILDALKPHSTADNIVAAASFGNAYVVDVERKASVITLGGFEDKGQSVDWSEDGKLLAISADKGRQIYVYDARSGSLPIQTVHAHQGLGRESRVLFCGDRLLSSGFTSKRVQEVHVVETGKWDKPIHKQEYVSTTGVLMPFYDTDTKLLFLVGKGTNRLFLAEFRNQIPFLSSVYEVSLMEQNLGACIGSKTKVNVMSGEVDTFYQLTKNSILPIPCIVPRRSYHEFHPDLFPDTRGPIAGCSSSEWIAGSVSLPAKISLAPNAAPPIKTPKQKSDSSSTSPSLVPHDTSITVSSAAAAHNVHCQSPPQQAHHSTVVPQTLLRASVVASTTRIGEGTLSESYALETTGMKHEVGELAYTVDNAAEKENNMNEADRERANSYNDVPELCEGARKLAVVSSTNHYHTFNPTYEPPIRIRQTNSFRDVPSCAITSRVRPKSCIVGQMASKFRHVETLVGSKANNAVFSNLRNVNTQLPPEANGACASGKFVAVPLKGPAGIIGIYDVDKPCKIPDGVMDGIFNKALVTDLHWNPFDDGQLAVGLDIGAINFWRLDTNDELRNEMKPEKVMVLGRDKVLCFQWHPLASDLLAVALSDSSIEIWDCKAMKKRIRIVSHSAPVLALAWSFDGHRLASVGKDLMLNVHQPQLGLDCLIAQKKVLDRGHAARILFACDDRLIVVVNMTKSSARQVQLYDASSLSDVHIHQIDNGTQPLVPHYDYDSSILFLSSKGSRIINMFEVCYDSPYLLPLTPYMAPVIGQAVAYHNKRRCNVMAVEFQRAWRLTEKSLEELIFRVPRVKKDVFQSDLFPDALVTWRPVMTADEWLAGSRKTPHFESLKPEGIPELAPSSESGLHVKSSRFSALPEMHQPVLNERKELDQSEVHHSWSSRIPTDTTLEQDHMEGVAEEEWNESL